MWMPSLDLATGLWARMRRTLYTLFSRLSRAAQRFWMSRAYFPVLLTVSAAFMAAGEPVYGVAARLELNPNRRPPEFPQV